MVQVYYHYAGMMSKRASRCRVFRTRVEADRWIFFMGERYPKFQLDDVFESR